MSAPSPANLKIIRFEGELLPDWTQLLDAAARLCAVPSSTRQWFSRFAQANGVDDASTVLERCDMLQDALKEHRAELITELQRDQKDSQPAQIIAAWNYALDTMIQVAQTRQTCSWIVEEAEPDQNSDSDGGTITLRRV